MRIVATMMATAALGIVSLGAAACNDDGGADAASSAPAATPGASSASSAPSASATPAVPSLITSPQAEPSKKPKTSGTQVIMIDPDGKKYTRNWIVRNAMMMAGMTGKKNFCSMSYNEGIKGGGKFPAGKAAFMDACEEGVGLSD